MGPMFSDTRSEVISGENMFGAVGIYSATPDNVLSRIITGDETWIHHWDPDTKQESLQWKHVNCPPPRKFRTQRRLDSHSHNFLGLQRCAAGGLPTTEDNSDWTILR